MKTLFLESLVTDENILQENARSVKISSPDVCKYSNPVTSSADNL
jgi:hypothetical protein